MPPDEIVVVHGVRCTTVERALYDEMQRVGGVHEMAITAGAAYAAQLTSRKRMRLYAATRRWYRDVRTVTEAIEMSIEGCRSPQAPHPPLAGRPETGADPRRGPRASRQPQSPLRGGLKGRDGCLDAFSGGRS